MFDFRGIVCVRDGGDGGDCDFHDFATHVGQLVEVHGQVGGGQNHLNVGRESLEEELSEKGVAVCSSAKLVFEELLHPAEGLGGLPVAELFPADEFPLFGGCGTLDELRLEFGVGVVLWGPEEKVSDFRGECGTERADDILETCFLGGDAPCGKLGFDLGNQILGSTGQKGGSLMLTAAMAVGASGAAALPS